MIDRRVLILVSGYCRRPAVRRAVIWFFCTMFSAGLMPRANAQAPRPPAHTSTALIRPAQVGTDVPSLEVGKPLGRELSGDQSHSYHLTLAAGQYARVVVEQEGIDVVVKLFAPDGNLITAVDSPNGTQGPEIVHITSEATGTYRLEVRAFEKGAAPGRYEAELVELRPATPRDRERLAARRAFDEGERLREQATRDSLEAAVKKYEEALSLYRVIEDRSEQFTVLIGMGNTYTAAGEPQKALECFDQALQLARALGDKFRQARALGQSASVYRKLGETDEALRSGDEAAQLYRATGAKNLEVELLYFVGELYSLSGEHEKARDYFDQAMRLYQASGDKYGEAGTLESLGYSYHLQDEPSRALEYYNKALALWQVIGDKQREAIEQSLVSSEYARAGERQKALDHAEQALLLQHSIVGNKSREAVVLTNVGQTYYKLGEFEKALDYYREPLRLWQISGAKRNEAITRKHVASALRDLGRLGEARVNMEKSIDLLEFLRDHTGSPELQASFVASLFDFYEFYIDLLMRLHAADPGAGDDQAALAFAEKVKVRSLVELLAKGRVDLRSGVDRALFDRERSINERITARLDDLTKLLRGRYTDAQRSASEREIDALKGELSQAQAAIREHDPRYSALTKPQPLGVREIQRQVLDADTILLEYALGEERSYLWAVTPGDVRSYRLPPKAAVEAQVRRVYQLLTARRPVPGLTVGQQRAREVAADMQYRTQAAVLSRMLLGPVAALLGTKRVVIVADGALQYLPFGVLPAPSTPAAELQADLRPLILDHEIVSLPSASVLAVLRRELADRQPAPKTVAVLADPVFAPDDARVKLSLASSERPVINRNGQAQTGVVSRALSSTLESALGSVGSGNNRVNLRRLLFSRDEAEAILSMTPRQADLKALDFRANRSLAMSDELSHYQIVHFSTHGLLDSRHPELSGLVLSLVNEAGQPQEGFLRLHEIYNLRLGAELVVLSGCQTGLGKEVRGEGLVGITRGFMYAGAPRVVASLWEVDDAATAELMKRFYRGVLQEKLPPAAALRAAQIELLKKRHWQSPYYWGAFVLQGEWR
ncbi:MAG: CHAT domain-containing protein [Pyrinomonadaceae bacterium]